MAIQPTTTGLTYQDLQDYPEDNLRRELIDGELIVTAAPAPRHQRVVAKLLHRLMAYTEVHGGEVLPGPLDVYFTDKNVVEPDLLYVRPQNLGRFTKQYFRSAPDLVVEVSSPTTRRLELIRKRELYERFGVPEYWFVDLDADRVEVYRLEESAYGRPVLFPRGETVDTAQAPGFSVTVDDLLGPSEEG